MATRRRKVGRNNELCCRDGRGGQGKGYRRGVCEKGLERGGDARTCHPGNPRAPPKTRIKSCAIQIINNNDNEKKATAISQRIKKLNRSMIISQTQLKEARNKDDHTGLSGQQPRGPSRPLSHRRGAVPQPPGPSHPSRRSARGNPSPSARQRGRQPTNPVGLRGSPQAAPLPRSTRASPAASLLQSKQTPSPEVTSLPPLLAPPSRSAMISEATRGRAREHATSKFSSPRWHKCACATVFSAYLGVRGLHWESCRVLSGRLEGGWASVPTTAHFSRMMGCNELASWRLKSLTRYTDLDSQTASFFKHTDTK